MDTIYSIGGAFDATGGAFAAKMKDGNVVTWGNPARGGSSSRIQQNLKQGGDTLSLVHCEDERWKCGGMGSC